MKQLSIVSFLPDSAAVDAGLKLHDVILDVDGRRLNGLKSVFIEAMALAEKEGRSSVRLLVARGGELFYLEAPAGTLGMTLSGIDPLARPQPVVIGILEILAWTYLGISFTLLVLLLGMVGSAPSGPQLLAALFIPCGAIALSGLLGFCVIYGFATLLRLTFETREEQRTIRELLSQGIWSNPST